MWNYSFEVPILMILAIIVGFYLSRPRLPIRRNLIFIHVIVIETLTIIIDLLSVKVDSNYAAYSVTLVKTLNTLYFLAFFHRSYIFYLFAASVMKDTIERILPFWHSNISKKLQEEKEVIVAAHGNSLRGIIKYLKNISDTDIISLNLPTGIPYVFEFDENMKLVKDYFLADEETVKKLMEAVANQGK